MPDDTIGNVGQKIVRGFDDTGGVDRDSAVYVAGCSGTLITSRLVLSAAHCAGGWPTRRVQIGPWMRARGWEVLVGVDKTRPTFRTTMSYVKFPGGEDIVLVRLADRVPPQIARPARVLTQIPPETTVDEFLNNKPLETIGWGSLAAADQPDDVNTDIRQRAASRFTDFGYDGSNMFISQVRSGSQTARGDSGGPSFWTHPETGVRFLVGVTQGTGSASRVVATFGVGGLTNENKRKKDIRSWIDQNIVEDVLTDVPSVPLISWYHGRQHDNYASTMPNVPDVPDVPSTPTSEERLGHPGWSDDIVNTGHVTLNRSLESIFPRWTRNGYRAYRIEGYLLDPKQSPRRGTVPVFNWYSSDRGDNFLTTDPRWSVDYASLRIEREQIVGGPVQSGYRLFRHEGFAYDPHLPQPPDTIPLYSWWNGTRKDNFVSTDPRWSVDPLNIEWGGEHLISDVEREGYSLYRLEGYIYPPLLP